MMLTFYRLAEKIKTKNKKYTTILVIPVYRQAGTSGTDVGFR
jgi:hypothetical protein